MIDEDVLFEYALELLSPERAAEVETALAGDPALRATLDELRQVVGALPDALPPVTPSASARSRLLAAAEAKPRLVAFTDQLAGFLSVAQTKARELLESIADESLWEASPWPGVRLFHIDLPGQYVGADVGFVHVEAGLHFPYHEHLGEERVLVLQGGYESEGQVWRPGDSDLRDAHSRHDYTALEGPALIYLIVLYEGLDFPQPP